MRKILLVVLLALSLNADGSCDFWISKYLTSNKLLIYATDNKDWKKVNAEAKRSLNYIEHVGANCEDMGETVERQRVLLKKGIKATEAYSGY